MYYDNLYKMCGYSEEEIESLSEFCTISIKEKLADFNVQPVFELDQYLTKFPVDYSPMLPKKTIEEKDDDKIFIDEYFTETKFFRPFKKYHKSSNGIKRRKYNTHS